MPATKPFLHAIESDGTTVWIHGPQGECLGRFGRLGIDIHSSFEDQVAGKPQCLECTHERVTASDWQRFRAAMIEHYGIPISEDHRPSYLEAIAEA